MRGTMKSVTCCGRSRIRLPEDTRQLRGGEPEACADLGGMKIAFTVLDLLFARHIYSELHHACLRSN